MPKFFIRKQQIKENEIEILDKDINHIKNVLRKKIDDEIILCDIDEGIDYMCRISYISDEKILCDILEKLDRNVESNINVTILQGLPKFDKMELVIQKSVELGVYEIIPVQMKRSIVKLEEKDKIKKIQRWQKISEVAAKQSGRNIVPKIGQIMNVKDVCNLIKEYDIVLIAYENETKITLKQELEKLKDSIKKEVKIKIAILIGPEGGIDESEIELLKQNNAITMTLGKRILRTETVALNLLSIIMYEFEN